MLREEKTEVLVVGAGPVGMLTALLLSHSGVQVRIIDQESRTTSRTYSCALHPRTLKLLDPLGISRDVLSAGRLVERVAFYEGQNRRAEVQLSKLAADFPFVVVLAQSTFEQLLEERLKKHGRIHVEWNHRLSSLREGAQGAIAEIETLGVSAKGYIVPEMDWSVQKRQLAQAAYVVGADGPNSSVAHSLATEYDTVGQSEFYAVYEFESDWDVRDELRIVLDEGTTSVLWPLPKNRLRWSFQLQEEHLQDFPAKERRSLIVGDPELERADREFMGKLLQRRAPWFPSIIQELGWSADVEFVHRLARSFGRQHCWLVGDAAHQTSPAGMQSMNLGLLEAERLAGALIKILRENGSSELLERYDHACRQEWQPLLGLGGCSVRPRPKTDPWTQARSGRILTCLPASGDEYRQLLGQLQLDLA